MPYLVLMGLGTAACSDDEVDSDEQARRAYLCLDKSISKSLDLGFAGYTDASSANIAPHMANGDKAGTLTVGGQVDQGASSNKGMRLNIGMVGYDDTVDVVFDTSMTATDQPYLNMMLKMIPTGTVDGTLTANTNMLGVYTLTGDIKGTLTLNLTISGHLMMGTGGAITARVPGMTTVTGTATNSDGGVYNINITI